LEQIASSLLADVYGMKLHDRVNDAVAQASVGRIDPGPAGLVWMLRALLSKDEDMQRLNEGLTDEARQRLKERLMEEVATALCDGKLTEKHMLAWRNLPGPGFIQLQVIEAYRRAIRDDGSAPTITEVRTEFLEENKKTRLPKGFAFRKMLTQTFDLPLSKAKRGRPKNSNRSRRAG
jgi:hypothetical protein